MSDYFTLVLVAASMLAFQRAWGRKELSRWGLLGLMLSALTLTRAVFLPFSIGVAGLAVLRRLIGVTATRLQWRTLFVATAVFALVVGGWMTRNWQVSGMFRLTDDRGGIALSTREVFDHMTLPQIAAAFVYGLPGVERPWPNAGFLPKQ